MLAQRCDRCQHTLPLQGKRFDTQPCCRGAGCQQQQHEGLGIHTPAFATLWCVATDSPMPRLFARAGVLLEARQRQPDCLLQRCASALRMFAPATATQPCALHECTR